MLLNTDAKLQAKPHVHILSFKAPHNRVSWYYYHRHFTGKETGAQGGPASQRETWAAPEASAVGAYMAGVWAGVDYSRGNGVFSV